MFDMNKVKVDALKSIEEIGLIECFAEVYSKQFNVPIGKAKEIISAKFCKHLNIAAMKINSFSEEDILKENKMSQKDVSLDEYLDSRPVIKG